MAADDTQETISTQEVLENSQDNTDKAQEAFNRVSTGEVGLNTESSDTQDNAENPSQENANQEAQDEVDNAENPSQNGSIVDNSGTSESESAENPSEGLDNVDNVDNETIQGEIITIPSMPIYTDAPKNTNERLAEYLAEVENAIKNDDSVIAHTKYTLSGINELLSISKELWEMYRYNVDIAQNDNKALIEIKEHINLTNQYINKSLKQLDKTYKTTKALFDTTEDLLDESREQANAIARDTQVALEAFKEVEKLETRIVEIRALMNEFAIMKESVELLKQEIENTASSALNEVKTTLLTDKERYERELDQRKNEIDIVILNKIKYLDEKIKSFEIEFSKKQTSLNETITQIEALKTSLEPLSEKAEEHIAEFSQAAQDMKDNLDSVAAAQIADLTEIVKGIKATQVSIGHNFKHKTFTSNGVFNPSSNAVYHYVFLQGGTGATNGENAGGIATFGSILTARGGSGSTEGIGQKGEVIGAFVEVSSTQNVVVPDGGICIVSWSERGQTAQTNTQDTQQQDTTQAETNSTNTDDTSDEQTN